MTDELSRRRKQRQLVRETWVFWLGVVVCTGLWGADMGWLRSHLGRAP